MGLGSLLRYFIPGKSNYRDEIGGWSEHVSYWSQVSGVIVVRYEDLLEDTEVEMRRVLDFFDINICDVLLKECVLKKV